MTTTSAHLLLLLATSLVVCQLLKPTSSFSTSRSHQLERLLGNLEDIEDDEEPRDEDNGYEEEINHVMKRSMDWWGNPTLLQNNHLIVVSQLTEDSENKGTCTCTCETRPVAAHTDPSAAGPTAGIIPHPPQSESRYPESAALMRTATTATKEVSKSLKQQQQSRSDSKSGPKSGMTGTVAQRQQQQPKSAAVQRTPTAAATSSSGSYGHIVKVPPAPEYDMSEHLANDVITNEQEMAASSSEDEEDVDESSKHQEQPHSSHQETWSLGSRYPWERLPDTMCFREQCSSDRDCCRRFNICDRSARVCVDCWYGSTCTSERDCCLKYKYCQREWKPNPSTGKLEIVGGKCVSEL